VEREPLVSCLCVTQDRPAFMPWLLWGYARQTWARKELVIVDSSREPCTLEVPEGVRVVRARPGARVAEKRNVALDEARGDAIAWFDDDDWQHPRRLEVLLEMLGAGAPAAGPCEAWFVDLWTKRCNRYGGSQVIFNGAVFEREFALTQRFDPERLRGSDTLWLRALAARNGSTWSRFPKPLFLWLVHESNLSNPRSRRACRNPTSELATRVGEDAWAGTELELERLRERLGGERAPAPIVSMPRLPNGGQNRASRAMPAIIAGWGGRGGMTLGRSMPKVERPSPVPLPVTAEDGAASALEVSAFVKATVLDVPYVETMTRHMLAQAKFDFTERVLLIDPRLEFSGKYSKRARFERAALDAATSRLLSDGVIDRVVVVPYDAHEIERVLGRYFVSHASKVPTHAMTGGPVYPTLYGLETMKSDFIVQFDGDMFFHAPGPSWIEAGLEVLAADPNIWFAMLHGGPPSGPPGSRASLGPLNARRSSQDANARGWLFRNVSTRYFLTDRRRLRGRVPAARRGAGLLPLEQCLSVALFRERAARISLPSSVGWDLHAHSHGAPFSEWAPRIAELVARGIVPDAQRGSYDLRLDQPAMREAWQRTLHEHEISRPLPVQGDEIVAEAGAG
jgi:hypothetical protein